MSEPQPIKTIVFDWGDTLMVNDPQQSGPMLTWPTVAAVSGAAPALAALKDHYHLIIATNAADSRSREVRGALAHVGLNDYFEAVFTSGELGCRKPSSAFFQAIQSVLGLNPAQTAMVGDDYRVDVLGAHQAGWVSLWYNPTPKNAPGLRPLHDGEVARLEDLPALLAQPALPGYPTCLTWLEDQQLPHNLLAHVHAVAAAAYQLAVWLRAAGQEVNPVLTHRAALLHDLAKLKAMDRPPEQRIGHAELAARMLLDRGEPVLAECARRHALFAILQPDLAPRTWEEKLVYFADKLVEGARMAGLDDRIASLRQRYPIDSEKIAAMAPALYTLQDELCAAIGIPPSELLPRLKTAFYA
jgi:putative hydrolase of the HAD superfamily